MPEPMKHAPVTTDRAAPRGRSAALLPASTVLARWAERLVEEWADERDRPALRAELRAAQTSDGDARVPYALAAGLWERVAATQGDPDFGLSFAQRVTPRDLGVIGYFASTASTLGGALDRALRFHRLLKDPSEIAVTTDAAAVRVVEGPPPGEAPYPRHLAEAILATYVVLGRQWTGAPLAAAAVRFRHAAPADTRAHERIFGCRPAFGAAANELVLPGEAALLPLGTADAALGRYLEPVAQASLSALPAGDPLLADLSRAILAALPDGYPSIDRLAKKLGLSARSLQRRLEDRGTRYQDVVDSVRHEAAERLLADPSVSVAEVAFLLGFSDASGLTRAFRRWTGHAPRRRTE
jgi:AraC-like DNA-binding protein